MTPRAITIHDTRSGSVLPLEPRDPGRVSIYACGPTVYGRVHVGNARPFVVFSLFKRFLEHEGYEVAFVANVTDVNDKIYDAARAAGVPSEQLATEMTAHYEADTDGLGLGRPDHEPKARATIAEMVALIERLIERGHAYAVEGDVYFDVRSYPQYGELSHRDVEQMDQGEGGAGASLKRDPLDFALWKAWKEGEDTSWETPWGRGRPGWHIECSAMAEQLLGVGFDVHGGGSDLVFPHHENEAAQTCAAHGEPLARIWMHNGMVRLDGEKMAKSVGNIFLLHEALATHGRDALIVFFAGGHYRQPISYSGERLEEAERSAQRIRELGRRLVARRRRRRSWRRCASSSSPPSPTTSTRRERSRSPSTGSAAPTACWRPAARSAATTCARCCRCSRSTTCSTRARPPTVPTRRRRSCWRAARPPARRATSPPPTPCATSFPPSAGPSATAPPAPNWSRTPDARSTKRRPAGRRQRQRRAETRPQAAAASAAAAGPPAGAAAAAADAGLRRRRARRGLRRGRGASGGARVRRR